MAQGNRPSATNAEPAEDISAGDLKSTSSVPHHQLAWPASAMTFYGFGFIAGIDRGRELAEGEMAHRWHFAYNIVQGHANGTDYDSHREAVRARQIASCERQKAAARPWPDEVAA